MGGGKTELQAAETQGKYSYDTAVTTNDADQYIADKQSETVQYQSDADKEARMYEAKMNFEAVKYQADNDYKIALLEYKVEMEKAKNDAMRIRDVEAVNAQANMLTAEGDKIKAEADMVDALLEEVQQVIHTEGSGFGAQGAGQLPPAPSPQPSAV